MRQASTQGSVVNIMMDRQKVNEQLMELEKRVQGRHTSQHPVFPTMEKMLLGYMVAGEMRLKGQETVKEHNEGRQHLEHLAAGNIPRMSGRATSK